jgi:hypothetical protein
MRKTIEGLGAGFANELEYLTEINQLARLVPPLLFALVAGEKLDFTPVRETVLYLDYVIDSARRTIH